MARVYASVSDLEAAGFREVMLPPDEVTIKPMSDPVRPSDKSRACYVCGRPPDREGGGDVPLCGACRVPDETTDLKVCLVCHREYRRNGAMCRRCAEVTLQIDRFAVEGGIRARNILLAAVPLTVRTELPMLVKDQLDLLISMADFSGLHEAIKYLRHVREWVT
jgi:hypothetical protein